MAVDACTGGYDSPMRGGWGFGRANGLGVAERFLDGVPSGLSALMATALMATSLLGATMGVSKPDAYAVDRDVRRDDLVFIGR